MEKTTNQIAWHALSVQYTLKKLDSGSKGLSKQEAQRRLKKFSPNEITPPKPASLLRRFLRQFHNILIYILLGSACVTAFFHHIADTSVILGVIFLNAIFGCLQEGKAQSALSAIRNSLAIFTTVLRDGKLEKIPAKDITIGDVIFLQSGDKVPADLRLIDTQNLQTQESALTGESLPVMKQVEKVVSQAPLAERISMAYSSTIVTSGRGFGIVVATGIDTEVGRISEAVKKEAHPTIPLIARINRFGVWLTGIILLFAAITFFIGMLFWQDSIDKLLLAVVSIIVSAIPEGLPAVMTIILAIGVTRMARQNAIVARLPAIETMGSVTTICTDKTGTLTLNELAVHEIVTAKKLYETWSVNFDPHKHKDLIEAVRISILCNDAVLNVYSDPLDLAVLQLGKMVGLDLVSEQKKLPRTDFIPFESKHKIMATLHHDHSGKGFIFIKGVPEKILQISSWQSGDESKYWVNQLRKLAHSGQRVIAVAYKESSPKITNLDFKHLQEGFTILALFGLSDMPRAESKTAVLSCLGAGIQVKMITGDHSLTAANIAEQVGIQNPQRVITGAEIDRLTDDELCDIAAQVNVYARTAPDHKLRLVKALQAKHNIVAMTGDGVNDAPALMQADIGIAMGRKGTEAAKSAAAMVLNDDNFATIVSAISIGRTIYDNLKKAILFILPTSFAQCLAIVIAILFGWTLPITPVQILWINMVTTITLALALAFEPGEKDNMRRPPRSVQEPLLSPFLFWRTVFVSALIVAAVFVLFLSEDHVRGVPLDTVRTVIVNMVVVGEIVYLFNCRKIYSSSVNFSALFGSKATLLAVGAVLLLQAGFTYIPTMQYFFGSVSLGFMHWLYIVCLGGVIFVCVEIEKYLLRRKKKK